MRNVLLYSVLLVLLACSAVAQDLPATPTRLVSDHAGILRVDEVAELERSLARISKYGLAQAIVYIDKKVPAGADFEAYTLRMANAWGVGSAEKNDGIVLFVFTEDRLVRIEVGKGLEGVLTNDLAKSIIDNELRPAFRDERYAFGLSRAIDSIARTLDAARSAKNAKRK